MVDLIYPVGMHDRTTTVDRRQNNYLIKPENYYEKNGKATDRFSIF